jgi:hypothetical protein
LLLTVPPAGAGSQALPPLVVDAEVVYVNPVVPVMFTNCAAGDAPPTVKLNVSVAVGTFMVGDAVTFSVTLIVAGLPVAPVEVTVIEPVYWPCANPDGFTETLMLLETVPPAGAGSHPVPPLLVDAEVV